MSSAVFKIYVRDLAGLVQARDVTLRLCLDPSSAARLGSECRAHLDAPVTAQAPQCLPLLFFAEHRLDMLRTPANCRFPPFNGGGRYSPIVALLHSIHLFEFALL